jgi:hypothetical protein
VKELLPVLLCGPVLAAADWAVRTGHRAYAWFCGYFWTDCPLCGTFFGGHQWRDVDGKCSSIPHPAQPQNPSLGTAICPGCTRAGFGYWAPLIIRSAPREVPDADDR